MYAVIETGGKQYRVEVGTELSVELLDVEPGQAITFDRVLLVGDGDATSVGRPTVADAAVEAEVVRRDRGEKLVVFKYRPKARTRVKKGHRQDHIVLRVTDVKLNGRSAAEENRKAQDEAQTERQRLEEAAARQAAADAELAARLAQRQAESAPGAKPKARRTSRSAAPAERGAGPSAATDEAAATDESAATDSPASPARSARRGAGAEASDDNAEATAAAPETSDATTTPTTDQAPATDEAAPTSGDRKDE